MATKKDNTKLVFEPIELIPEAFRGLDNYGSEVVFSGIAYTITYKPHDSGTEKWGNFAVTKLTIRDNRVIAIENEKQSFCGGEAEVKVKELNEKLSNDLKRKYPTGYRVF